MSKGIWYRTRWQKRVIANHIIDHPEKNLAEVRKWAQKRLGVSYSTACRRVQSAVILAKGKTNG